MPQDVARSHSQNKPTPSWTVVTDAPLKGFRLAREAQILVVWDEAENLWLIDANGDHRSVGTCPGKVLAGSISDDGSLIALLGGDRRLWLLNADLELVSDRATLTDATTITVDPHGRFLAVSNKLNQTQLYNRYGKQSGNFETRQPLSHLEFVPTLPMMIGTASYGTIAGIELNPSRGSAKFDPEVIWQENLMSNVGRLAMSGDGGMILTACYTHGVQRYDLRGKNEGAYHLGGSPSFAIPDFVGRSIAVSTLEGELCVLASGGQVKSRMNLPNAPVGIAMDALGRCIYYGLPNGEICKLDLTGEEPQKREREPSESAELKSASSGQLKTADWSIPLATSDENAEFTVLAMIDEPPRIASISTDNKLTLFSNEGIQVGQAPDVQGVGRMVRIAPGWVAAATNKQIVLCDLKRNTARKLDLNIVELTHLALKPDTYGVGTVQESDRVGRATAAGRWVFRKELDSAVEELAIDAEGYTAVTLDDGRLLVLDPSGGTAGTYSAKPAEPLLLIDAPDGSPPAAVWVTVARRSQVIRAHDRIGKVLWEAPIPWEAWQLQKVGTFAVATAPDGRAIAFDGRGRSEGVGKATDSTSVAYAVAPDGGLLRVTKHGSHLIVSELTGKVRWRSVSNAPVGVIAGCNQGVCALIGRNLVYFSN